MKKIEQAIENFHTSHNCAQAVVSVFAKENGVDANTVLHMAAGFGSGMGGKQLTCGAITGAYMALGLKYGTKNNDNVSTKTIVKEKIATFDNTFIKKHKATTCRELTGCDLSTAEGQEFFVDNKVKDNVCSICVADAILLVTKL